MTCRKMAPDFMVKMSSFLGIGQMFIILTDREKPWPSKKSSYK